MRKNIKGKENQMANFIPFWKYNCWAISINLDELTVHAASDFGRHGTVVFQAKSEKQAWFAYNNPEKVQGLLKDHPCRDYTK